MKPNRLALLLGVRSRKALRKRAVTPSPLNSLARSIHAPPLSPPHLHAPPPSPDGVVASTQATCELPDADCVLVSEDYWSFSENEDVEVADATDEPFVPASDDEGDDDDQQGDGDDDFKLAVHESVRTDLQEQSKRQELEENKKENEAVDEWLHAVSGVPDDGEAPVREKKHSQDVEGKGKKPVIDLSDDDNV